MCHRLDVAAALASGEFRPAFRPGVSSFTGRIAAFLRSAGGVCVVLMALAATQGVNAQPSSLSSLATATSLTQADIQRIESVSQNAAAALVAARPEEIDDARDDLISPVQVGNPTELFRAKYFEAMERQLTDIIDSRPNPHVVNSALIVVAEVGSDKALTLLLRYASSRDESAAWVRLAAARGINRLFSDNRLGPAEGRQRTRAARQLKGAVELETDPGVLRHQLSAILAIDSDDLPEGNRTTIYERLAEALASVADRVKQNPAEVELLLATFDVVDKSLKRFIRMDSAAKRNFGGVISAGFASLLDGFEACWETGASSKSRMSACRLNIAKLETTLERTMAIAFPSVPVGDTTFAKSWDDRDQPAYQGNVTVVTGVVGTIDESP